MPYQSILDRLLRYTDGAAAALLFDSTGEVVAEAPADDCQRLIGIYQGILLAAARRALRPLGDIQYVLTRHEAGTVILRPLRDGYYVVLSLRPGSDVALGLLRSATAQARMNEAM